MVIKVFLLNFVVFNETLKILEIYEFYSWIKEAEILFKLYLKDWSSNDDLLFMFVYFFYFGLFESFLSFWWQFFEFKFCQSNCWISGSKTSFGQL